MKKLSEEEFKDRMMALHRARRIFIESGLTKNITTAFTIYQEIFADRERELLLTSRENGRSLPNMMDKYEPVNCLECGAVMMLRTVPKNDDGIQTMWVCSNTEHTGDGSVLYSEHDLAWWTQQLKKKDSDGHAGTS